MDKLCMKPNLSLLGPIHDLHVLQHIHQEEGTEFILGKLLTGIPASMLCQHQLNLTVILMVTVLLYLDYLN